MQTLAVPPVGRQIEKETPQCDIRRLKVAKIKKKAPCFLELNLHVYVWQYQNWLCELDRVLLVVLDFLFWGEKRGPS